MVLPHGQPASCRPPPHIANFANWGQTQIREIERREHVNYAGCGAMRGREFANLGLTQIREIDEASRINYAGSRAIARAEFAILGLTQDREVRDAA
jgi:hypothetical protein